MDLVYWSKVHASAKDVLGTVGSLRDAVRGNRIFEARHLLVKLQGRAEKFEEIMANDPILLIGPEEKIDVVGRLILRSVTGWSMVKSAGVGDKDILLKVLDLWHESLEKVAKISFENVHKDHSNN